MQACVDVGGDREQKHEAPVDDEPEDEPEDEPAALDIGGDREALGLTSDAKGKCPRQRKSYWRSGRLQPVPNESIATGSFVIERSGCPGRWRSGRLQPVPNESIATDSFVTERSGCPGRLSSAPQEASSSLLPLSVS